ncbi:MAG: glycosyltransferase family 4 protein [Gracilimonas sp.]
MQRVSMQLVRELQIRPDIEIMTVIQQAPWNGIKWRTALFLIRMKFKLPQIVKEFNPDVILFSSMVTGGLALLAGKNIDTPMVTINHGRDVKMPNGFYQNLVPKVFNALHGVISVSEATRAECIKRGMHPDKGIALPNGFHEMDFETGIAKDKSREIIEEKFDVNLSGKGLLLTVGRQVKRKGHDWFIREVLPKINSEIYYLIVGDGPEHERLNGVVSNSPNTHKIILAGRQPDELLKHAYAAADIFIMPNIPVSGDMEGFGIVLLEANLASTFAIASDLEGIKDVIKDGVNGFKIPVHDSKTFARKINEVLASNPGEFGKQSSKYVKEFFSWNSVADRYISYLKEIIENYKSAASR